MRMTVQRRVILEQLRRHSDHPGAEVLYDEVRQILPRVSLGTVYRNLDVLTETGMIQRIDSGGVHAHFDPVPVSHPHFVCDRCGAVRDLSWKNGVVPGWKQLAEGAGLEDSEVKVLRLFLSGICAVCRSNEI
jgi:Fur family transcriptional regulator, peroxide stress response regulator